MKKFDIDKYFTYRQESESDGWDTYTWWVIRLNAGKIVKDFGIKAGTYAFIISVMLTCDRYALAFTQAKHKRGGWYETTSSEEGCPRMEEEYITDVLKPSLEKIITGYLAAQVDK